MPLTTYTAGEVLTAASLNANLSFAASNPSSAVVQVKSTIKSDTFTTTSATMTDITGLSVSITPTSASNKILVFFTVNGQGATGATQGYLQLVRDSTAIAIGDAASVRPRVSGVMGSVDAFLTDCVSLVFLDSPATTAATTYKVQTQRGGGGTVYINRTENDADNTSRQRTVSTITVMEVTP
jgi:hypothetical protein